MTREFHRSISDEINALSNRVTNLIQHSHNLSSGEYREAILRKVIKRYLPKNLEIGRGFVIDLKQNISQSREEVTPDKSTQIDILIFDKSYPILFSEGDFYIITSDSVRAIIEVKSTLTFNFLEDSLEKMNKNGAIIKKGTNGLLSLRNELGVQFFNGIFGFKTDIDISRSEFKILMKENCFNVDGENNYNVNCITLDSNQFIRHDHRKSFRRYEMEDLSYTFFISNLLDYVTPFRINKVAWFPINKELDNYKQEEYSKNNS